MSKALQWHYFAIKSFGCSVERRPPSPSSELPPAQDDGETEEKVEAPRREDLQKFRVEQQRQRLQTAYRAQFDRWLFSQFRTRDGARRQLETLLAVQLHELDAECHLTAAQLKKLQLAGRGDIKRFMDRFDDVASTVEDPQSSIDDLRTAMGEIRVLRAPSRQQLFGEGSLLCKTLTRVLDQDQAAAREKALLERNKLRHRAAINAAMKTLQSNLGMSDAQCAELAELLFMETRPPRRFGNAPDVALILFQASRLPEVRIKSIFDDSQWRIISRWMAIYIQGRSGEKTLKRNGFVFDDEPAKTLPDRFNPVSRKDGTQVESIGPSRLGQAQP